MGKPRNTAKYRLWRGGKLVSDHPYGITDRALEERERELQQQFPGSHIKQKGIRTTRERALEWERRQYERRGGKS